MNLERRNYGCWSEKNGKPISSFVEKDRYSRISRLHILLFNTSFRMLRELKIFRRNSGKNPTTDGNNENIPVDQAVSSTSHLDADPSRPPFNTIQEPTRNPKSELDQETHFRRKNEKIPSKGHTKGQDQFFQLRTPEKLAAGKGRFGWVPKGEQPVLSSPEIREDPFHQGQFQLPPPPPLMASHALNIGNGYRAATAHSITTGGKASSVQSGTSSTQSTPTKSFSKTMFNGVSNSRAPQYGGSARDMNILVSSKGVPSSSAPPPVFASAEVPHFDLKEDPSFWMDHNVQVVIRVRPINSMERSLHGYSRCIKQESAQSITWIGQSETRFTFDYVACETVNQEMLFRAAGFPMAENCMSGYNSCVFAYGQTGSGKTHTMLGEINDFKTIPSANRGMTPRIFEFLFARIKEEEESRRDEKLQYICKCSFLEIYNEQITDLLNPSSNNLLIREDPRKGVHVENLTEFEVENVYDILKLLIQGAANRKVAATNMNLESSRSHSVFTCTIESRWQTDSAWTFRFARLNLVDLAGCERQKTTGADGDRLKEASNINKSLSTLGHVIMVLADLANGRQRHVPYRDSRLTRLLQDSLGGNSKTMIIANVSPSICSANVTLSTLKFAQRAKTIQNNAVVNENASGDVFALQHHIHLLKEEVSMLKQQNISRSLSFRMRSIENAEYDVYSPLKLPEVVPDFNGMHDNEELRGVRVSNKQLKLLEATLAGAFRREKMADVAKKQLEAEIEQLNYLVRQREEDNLCSKMIIKFRKDEIYRMAALQNGLIPSDSYLREENNALSEEIKLLRTKVDINPEVTRFATENLRLLRQLRELQDFYDEGERDLLLTEISDLRNQLGQFLDGKFEQEQHSKSDFNAQELEIHKAIIEERKSSCIKAEERANLVETELSRAKEKLLQISTIYDVTEDKLNNEALIVQVANKTLRDELGMKSIEKAKVIERLKMELLNERNLLDQTNHVLEDLHNEMCCIKHEKSNLESHVSNLNEKLTLVEGNEAIAAKQMENLLMENEELKLRLMEMSVVLEKLHRNEVICKESENMKIIAIKRLKKELLNASILLSKISHILQEFLKDINVIKYSKEQLESQVSILKECLEMVESLTEVNEVVATEAQQIAGERKSYAQFNEDIVLLFEKSFEEFQCTVNVLQEQVKIVKEEAERKRLQRNELEMEEDSACDTAKRHPKNKLTKLDDAQYNIQQLQKEMIEKELEIVHCKSIISELSLHAEAQASEYKRKKMNERSQWNDLVMEKLA